MEKLSGGERKRLYLCTVLIQNPNFLILDEPTNDLDVLTLNVLENFLIDFPGCLLVVSHDRYFMDKIVEHLFVFRGNAVIEDFPGSYSDFRKSESQKSQESKTNSEEAALKSEKNDWREKAPGGKLSYSEQREYQKLEDEILQLEQQKEAIQLKFSDSSLSGEAIDLLSINLKEILDRIAEKTTRWFELSERKESFK